VRVALRVVGPLLLFFGTLALVLPFPDAAFLVLALLLPCILILPFVRLDLTPWLAAPPLAALGLWAGSAPGYYVLPLVGATILALLLGVVMLVRFGPLQRRRPPTKEAKRAWVTALVLGILIAFVSGGRMPLELRFRLSEDEMRHLARDVLDGRRDPAGIEWVGLWKVKDVERFPGGVRFLVDGAGLFDQHGFLYVTNGLPPPDARYYGSGWFTWSTDFEL
jgi:hypothetical protein